MDKLRPVLKQMFWICTGFVVLLTVGGWWMALGDLREQINKGESKLKSAENASKAGGNTASAAWTNAAKQVNAEDQRQFQAAEADLHQRQLRYRSYPEKIAGEFINKYRFGSRIDDTALRGEFGKLYLDHFLEQLKVLNPFIVQDNKGLIDVDVSQITQANPSDWPNMRPSSAELWKAQEDLWLLRSLFESINSANAGAQRLGTAPVRQLIALKLRGGKRGYAASGSSGGSLSGGSGGAGGFGGFGGFTLQLGKGDSENDRPSKAGSRSRRRRGSAGRSSSNPGSGFQGTASDDLLSEEFGPEPGFGGIGSSSSRKERNKWEELEEDDEWGESEKQEETTPAPTGDGVESELTGRYVDDAAEYRTRAFLLHVKVHHAHIPVLLAELTNSSFPVEIVRVDASFEAGTGGSPMRSSYGSQDEGRRGRRDRDSDERSGFRFRSSGVQGGRGLGGSRRSSGSGSLLAQLASPDPNPSVHEQGQSQLATALADPALATVRIAGLMTIYRTKEENAAAKATELDDINTKMQQAAKPAASDGDQAPSAPATATADETSTEEASATDETTGDAEDAAAPPESGGGEEADAGDADADADNPAAEPEPPTEQNPLLSP